MIVSSPFRYVEHPSQYHVENALLVVIPRGIGTKNTLLNTLESLLAFPAYFGFNWDALFDCFRDLSWLSEHTIVLIHPELPMLPRPELEIYLRLLRDSVLDWHPEEAHRLDVIFAESDKETVERCLRC